MSKKISPAMIQDAYKRIRSNLDLSRRPSSIVAVLSADPKEGRSTVAYNLACSYADKGDKVLLVDADVLSNGLQEIAGVHPKKGLREVAADYDPMKPSFQAEYLEEIQAPSGSKLYFVGTGEINPQADVIHSKAFAKFIHEAAREVDRVILDAPASSASADAYAIGALADESVFVYSGKDTPKQDAKEALEDLERNGAVINGVVMTNIGKAQA